MKPLKKRLPAEVKDAARRFGTLLFILISVVLDLAFLVGWAIANHYGEILLHKWHVEDQFSFKVLQWCFRISTLLPIAAFVLADFIRVLRRLGSDVFTSRKGGKNRA